MTREQLPQVALLRHLGNTLCLGNFLLPNMGLALHPVLGLAAHWARLVQHSTARHSMAWNSTRFGMAQHGMAHLTAQMLLAAIPGDLFLDSIPGPPGPHGRFGRMLETPSHEPRTTGRRLEIMGEKQPLGLQECPGAMRTKLWVWVVKRPEPKAENQSSQKDTTKRSH